jgi:hypothetical protein
MFLDQAPCLGAATDTELIGACSWLTIARACATAARGEPGLRLPARALAVFAPRPAARPSLAFLKLLLGPPDAALAGLLLLGLLDPADELVAG